MEVPADQSTPTSAPRGRAPIGILSSPRRRRPTGEPPPLPYHLQTSGVRWLIAALAMVALPLVVFAGELRGPAVAVTVADDAVVRWLAGLHAPGLVGLWRALAAISSWWVLNGLLWGLVLALLALRRFRQLILVVILAQLVGLLVENLLGPIAQRPRPFGVVIRAGWGGWALPSAQVTFFAALLVVVLYTLVAEGRWRNTGKWVATGLVALTALGRVALGADAPTDVLVAAAIGVTIPLLAFRRFIPSEVFPVSYRRGRSAHLDVGGARGAAIRRAVQDQLGVVVLDVEPFGQQFSASSTPLRLKAQGDPQATYLFAKLYAIGHLRADRWYKLGRELLYGRLEDEKPFNSVRRLVVHEDYALRLLRDRGLPVPKPVGSVELTPEREYLLVTEFLDGAKEISEVEVDDTIIDEGLAIVRRLWDAGLAHRDIKPANLLVQAGHVRLIDTFLTEVHASPWRQAVDLENMMMVLALGAGPERVYQRALRQFTVEEITEAFAAKQGRAMPSQVRELLSDLRLARSVDLHAEFVRLLPTPPQPIRIQRWTARRVGLWAIVAALLALVGATAAQSVADNEAGKTPLNTGNLGCSRLEPLWLEAQSVPSASLVPCVRSLPTGWTLADVAVNDGRSVLTLNNDRAGTGAMVVRLTAACDIRGATQVPSEQPGARQFMRIERLASQFSATRFAVFAGGCVTTRISGPAEGQDQLTSDVPVILGFTPRQLLQQALEQRSNGRLRLDPAGTR
jgi:tRNA A-37 threonylcarbamoyl transferase component Bud32/membrane-associated phospholipid phosphatase